MNPSFNPDPDNPDITIVRLDNIKIGSITKTGSIFNAKGRWFDVNMEHEESARECFEPLKTPVKHKIESSKQIAFKI